MKRVSDEAISRNSIPLKLDVERHSEKMKPTLKKLCATAERTLAAYAGPGFVETSKIGGQVL